MCKIFLCQNLHKYPFKARHTIHDANPDSIGCSGPPARKEMRESIILLTSYEAEAKLEILDGFPLNSPSS